MLLQNKETSNRLPQRMSLQSPTHHAMSFDPIKCASTGFTSPKSRINCSAQDKLQVIKKHIEYIVSEHPQETNAISLVLRDILESLYKRSPSEAERSLKTTTAQTQTDLFQLPAFCQQISIISEKPKSYLNEKCSTQYMKARQSIYQEIYADNEALVRENLQLSEENLQLSETIESLTVKYNEVSRRYEELEKTIEMLHEVGSVYNSKAIPQTVSEKEDIYLDTKYVFSPRSSNLSSRKSCLSTKNQSSFFDRLSNRRVNFMDGSQSPKILIYKEYSTQTEHEMFILHPNDFRQELILYENTVSTLIADNAQKQMLLSRLSDTLKKYLCKDIGPLTIDNIDDIIEQLYKKRGCNFIRRKTMNLEDIQDPSSIQFSSEKRIEIVEKSYRRLTRRRG